MAHVITGFIRTRMAGITLPISTLTIRWASKLRRPSTRLGRSIPYAMMAIWLWVGAGCAGTQYSWETSTVSTPPSPYFDPLNLTYQPVAVIPVVTPPRLRGYGPGLSLALHDALNESSPVINAIPSHETLNRFNRQGIAEEYILLIRDWDDSGILERTRLKKIGKALGARFVLVPGIAEFQSQMEDRFTFGGLLLVRNRTLRFRLSMQLWSTTTGELIWESFGGGTMTREVVREGQGLMGALAKIIWATMIQDLQHGKTTTSHMGGGDAAGNPDVDIPKSPNSPEDQDQDAPLKDNHEDKK